jgi:hypothetical protein
VDEEKEMSADMSATFERIQSVVLAALFTISIGLSAYVFKTIETRIAVQEIRIIAVEQVIAARGERVAVLEQQARDKIADHAEIKLMLSEILKELRKK